ncbi:MAG: GH92 family glycosyl hydrolase [Ginsengibacter sp.]
MNLKKIVLVLFTSIHFASLSAQIKQPVDYVNPFIGTEKSSHRTVWESRGATFPGVLRPFGMVQVTPNGYLYSDKKIQSFSFINHASGYFSTGSFNLMAFTGDSIGKEKIAGNFDHANEMATPYCYQVILKNSGINAAFTATERTALCTFTFTQSATGHFVLSDITNAIVIDSNTISGRCQGYYFIMQFSKAFDAVNPYSGKDEKPEASVGNTFPSAIIIDYAVRENETILVKIGFSTASFKGVENNIQMEQTGWDFEQTKLQSKKIWNEKLSQVEVKTPNENTKEIFYTALYHSMFMPVVLSDADAPKDDYGPLFPWDTYRSEHPLITLLDPPRESDMVASVLAEYDKTGWLPTDNMMGNHNTELILDSYVKGASGFNTSKAADAMSKSLTVPPYARREMGDFVQYKFVPANITNSVTHSLEYAYNCWAVARFLEKTGNKKKFLAQYNQLIERAGYFKNSFDASTGFMRAKTTSGEFTTGGYAEGTEWTYSWFAPHDIQGLINLMGGNKAFSEKLSQCFEEGHYVHDNEPPLHYAYLFNYGGHPWQTQLWARKITEDSYSTDPGGLPGNDDLGTLSSWYVFSAMGFYPVTPGTDQYQIGSPVFEETIIHLSNGHDFILKANNVSVKNKYIQSATLSGVPFNRPWLTQEEIASGKTLVLEMGPEPNKTWGSSATDKPYSMTKGTPDFVIQHTFISASSVKANTPVQLAVQVLNKSAVAGTFSVPVYLDGRPLKTISKVLGPGENSTINSTIILFQRGVHRIEIEGTTRLNLQVQKTAPTFIYNNLTLSTAPLVKLLDTIGISATVTNAGSDTTSVPVQLFINKVGSKSMTITLEPGEEKEISFNYLATKEGINKMGIASLQPLMVNVVNHSAGKKYTYDGLAFLKPLLIMDFDEGPAAEIRDFSGLGNNGIVKGNLNWVEGAFGKAIQTNAYAGNYIEFPATSSLDKMGRDVPITMMAWVYPDNEQNFADIISKGDWNSLQIKGSNQLINFYASGWEGHEATAPVPENWNHHWHHLAGVADGIFFKLYVDGKLVETKKGEPRNAKGETGTANYSGSLWNIGRNAGSTDRVFRGYIDDVMIFKTALNQQQIANLMLHNF